MIVINLIVKERFHAVHDPPGAGDHAHGVVAGVVPSREPDSAALGIREFKGALLNHLILVDRVKENLGFFAIQQARHKNKSILLKLSSLFCELFVHDAHPFKPWIIFAWAQPSKLRGG